MKGKCFRFILSMTVFLAMLCCAVILLSKEAVAFTLPDTGQTKCYSTAGTEISCTGSGQDGAYSINPMSYTDNGNGTVTDNVTGLMWQKGENATKYTGYKASGTYDEYYNPSSEDVCGSLTLGGHSDWRLPAKMELMSIVDYGKSQNPTINTNYFPKAYSEAYWSSTDMSKSNAKGTQILWVITFNTNPETMGSSLNGSYYVRCVRGGQSSSSPSLTDNGNGTVTDNGTGLMWQQGEKESKAEKKTWADALTYCEGLNLGGQSDWRLPNIKELFSITDDAKYNPAIDTTYLPNVGWDTYWSSTTSASDTGNAFVVFFGASSNFYHDSKQSYYLNYVRCVRSGQSGTVQNNCAASVSPNLVVNIPIVTYSGSNYWADLQYNSATSTLTVADSGAVSDASFYSSCTASTLSSDFKLHIPAVMIRRYNKKECKR